MFSKATLFFRAIVLCIGAAALLFAVMLFPELSQTAATIAREASLRLSPWFSYVNVVFLVGIYAAALPFFFALFQTMKLLRYIDKKNAFAAPSERALKKIAYSALSVFALYVIGVMPIAYCFAELDDAPGVILMGLAIGLLPLAVAALAAILQGLLKEAMALKPENT